MSKKAKTHKTGQKKHKKNQSLPARTLGAVRRYRPDLATGILAGIATNILTRAYERGRQATRELVEEVGGNGQEQANPAQTQARKAQDGPGPSRRAPAANRPAAKRSRAGRAEKRS
jgi:hypothetical protein